MIKFATKFERYSRQRGDTDSVFSYLRIQAIRKVMAGTTLLIAEAKVAVVYFSPKKYKFWSRTGLPIRKLDCSLKFPCYESVLSCSGNYSRMLSATIFVKIEIVILGLCFLLR